MNQKEISELRWRFKADRCAISRIYGCYVNSNKEVVSYIDDPSVSCRRRRRGNILSF